jgi:hypothetical protein
MVFKVKLAPKKPKYRRGYPMSNGRIYVGRLQGRRWSAPDRESFEEVVQRFELLAFFVDPKQVSRRVRKTIAT